MKAIIIITLVLAATVLALPGGWSPSKNAELSSPQVREIVEKSLQAALNDQFNNFQILSMKNMQQQVVSGMNYKFDVELKNIKTNQVVTKNVQVYRNLKNEYTIRQFNDAPTLLGGWTPVQDLSLTNSAITNIISETLSAAFSNDANLFTLVKINSMEKQVVAGMKYRFEVVLRNNKDNSEVTRQFVVYKNMNAQLDVQLNKEVVPMKQINLGGWYEHPNPTLQDSLIKSILSTATPLLFKENSSAMTPVAVKSFATQVVAGINYKIEVVYADKTSNTQVTKKFQGFKNIDGAITVNSTA